jgi:hypothetical protein
LVEAGFVICRWRECELEKHYEEMWGVEIVGAFVWEGVELKRRASRTKRLGVELEFRAQHFQAWKPDLNSFDSKLKVKTFYF